MPTHRRRVHIDTAPEHIWAAVADVAGWPSWSPSVDRAERLEAGPLRVGARTRLHQPGLRPAVWEVTSYDEGRAFAWTTRTPGLVLFATHRVQPDATGDGAVVELGLTASGPLAGVVWLLLGRRIQRAVDQETDGLRAVCATG